MLSSRAKQELETLQNRLHSWQGTVSQRARRFHEVRSELEDQVRKNLSSWRLWIPPDELKRLQDRTDRLDPISKTLAALIPQAEQWDRQRSPGRRQPRPECARRDRGRSPAARSGAQLAARGGASARDSGHRSSSRPSQGRSAGAQEPALQQWRFRRLAATDP